MFVPLVRTQFTVTLFTSGVLFPVAVRVAFHWQNSKTLFVGNAPLDTATQDAPLKPLELEAVRKEKATVPAVPTWAYWNSPQPDGTELVSITEDISVPVTVQSNSADRRVGEVKLSVVVTIVTRIFA